MTTPQDTPLDSQPAVVERSLGQRFRAAREARQLAIADVAATLRAPAGIVEAIEADQLDRLGATVFARGYLMSYARLLDLPTALVDATLARRPEMAEPLRSSVHVSRSRHLIDRYARKGAYLVLTASIVLPVVWLATQDQLPIHQLGLRSLDAPVDASSLRDAPLPPAPVAVDGGDPIGSPVSSEAVTATIDRAASATTTPAAAETAGDVHVVASLTPFYQRNEPRPTDVTGPSAPTGEAADGGWRLSLAQDSWVEILDQDGRRLEYGLLRAGEERRYPADRISSVSVGNAGGVTLSRDGEALDLRPYQRANVARFTVSSDGRIRPPGG